MKKILDILSKMKSYIISGVACLVMYLFSPQILGLLSNVVEWIQPCPQWCFATLILTAGLYSTYKVIVKIKGKTLHLSDGKFAFAIFLMVVYSYFRFFDKSFEFWPLKSPLKWTDIFYLPFVSLLFLKFTRKAYPDPVSQKPLLPDEPICEPQEDALGYDTLSEGLLKDLNATDVSKRSYSVGIVGSWGQGKSSFMNLFRYHAEKQGSIVVTFNPRSSKSIKTIQEDFFNRFKEELSHYHTDIERHISQYAKEVATTDEGWIGKAALAISVLSQSEEQEHVNSIIEQIHRRVFVLIEDFDRLTGKEILEVLKLIDANGDFCNTVYLTAYDKKYVNEVLNNYLGVIPEIPYTDKYFNYEYLLPSAIYSDCKNLFKNLLSEKLSLPESSIIKKESLIAVWDKIGNAVVSNLPNFRHIKRYFNIFASRYLEVVNDVDASDFMLLTLLRYKDISAYKSLFSFSFLRRGSTLNGSEKMVYLQDEYKNNETYKSLLPESKEIIEMLFSVAKNSGTELLTEAYHKLRWVDSFNSYFYDYRIGKYHLEDFYALFKLPEEEAFSKLKEIYSAGYYTQLEDFLNTRDYNWVANEAELERMIKLTARLDSLQRSMNLQTILLRFTRTSAEDDFIKSGIVKNKNSYKEIVEKSFRESQDFCSMEIGFVCQIILDAVNSNQLEAKEVIFTTEELIGIAVWAQKVYYKNYPDGDYIFDAILNLANIREIQDNKLVVTKAAQEEFVALMKLYPDKFANDVVLVTPPYDNNGQTYINLRFSDYFKFHDYLPEDEFTLYDWISNIQERTTAYVLESIVEKALKDEVLTVPALKSEYKKGDFEGFYGAIKAKEESDDDKAVQKAIQNNNMPDLYSLGIASSMPKERVESAIKRLVAKGLVDGEHLNIKDRIDPFEKGDLIKLTDSAFEKVQSQLIYSNNVFKILELSADGFVKLSDLGHPVSISDIEGIKINGIQDRDIYYDPIIAAPIVPYDAPAPVMRSHRGEYYMDGLANTIYNNKTFKQLVLEADCMYVHEVQHYLRKHFNSDDLKVDEKIK